MTTEARNKPGLIDDAIEHGVLFIPPSMSQSLHHGGTEHIEDMKTAKSYVPEAELGALAGETAAKVGEAAVRLAKFLKKFTVEDLKNLFVPLSDEDRKKIVKHH